MFNIYFFNYKKYNRKFKQLLIKNIKIKKNNFKLKKII